MYVHRILECYHIEADVTEMFIANQSGAIVAQERDYLRITQEGCTSNDLSVGIIATLHKSYSPAAASLRSVVDVAPVLTYVRAVPLVCDEVNRWEKFFALGTEVNQDKPR